MQEEAFAQMIGDKVASDTRYLLKQLSDEVREELWIDFVRHASVQELRALLRKCVAAAHTRLPMTWNTWLIYASAPGMRESHCGGPGAVTTPDGFAQKRRRTGQVRAALGG